MSENENKIILEGAEGDFFKAMSADELLSSEVLLSLYDIKDLAERARIRALLVLAARDLRIERDVKEVLKAYDAADAKLQHDYQNGQSFCTMFSFDHQPLDCGYWVADDNGVRMQKATGEMVYASRIPVVPVALLENISTGTEKVKLLFYKGGKKSLICERRVTASSSKIVELADKGIEVTSENSKLLVRYISDCITGNLGRLPYYKAFSQLGWNDYGFTPYSSEAVFDGEDENKHLFLSINQKGKLGDWTAFTHDLRSNLHIRLAMAASFASVLIEPVGALPFVFHLWGKTGTGKTVALKVAMSIWGDPKLGKLTRTMNMTQNSMMSTAAFLNSLPFAGDELQTIKSKWDSYDQLIMRITEGIDRGRMNFNKNEETKTWHCSFIFTGEDPCTHAASGGGVKNRVIQAEVTEPLCVVHSGNESSAFVEKNYGHAGKAFIEYISDLEDLPQRFREIYTQILKEVDTTEKQASSMALMLLADKLACECIYLDEEPLKISDCSQFLFSSSEVDIGERAFEFIVNHIGQNHKRFDYDNHGETWGQIKDEGKFAYINASVLRRELSAAGFEFDAVKKKWAEKNYIKLSSDGRYTHRTVCYGAKARYVIINLPEVDPVEDNTNYDEVPF